MNPQAKILARVRKLLSLSKSSTDAEAALAAARAAEMMAEHQLSEAEVRLVDGGKAEAIVEGDSVASKKRVAWQWTLAHAAATQYGCKSWNQHQYGAVSRDGYVVNELQQQVVRMLGRESAIQAATYTAQFLVREVERLCEEAWEREGDKARKVGQSPRTWKNSFRLGAAGAISRRIHAQVRDKIAERAIARDEARSSSKVEAITPAGTPVTKLDAMVLVEREENEVEEVYAAKAKRERFGTSAAIGRVRSRTGYSAGQEAGARASLGGGRAAIGQGAAKLRGGK